MWRREVEDWGHALNDLCPEFTDIWGARYAGATILGAEIARQIAGSVLTREEASVRVPAVLAAKREELESWGARYVFAPIGSNGSDENLDHMEKDETNNVYHRNVYPGDRNAGAAPESEEGDRLDVKEETDAYRPYHDPDNHDLGTAPGCEEAEWRSCGLARIRSPKTTRWRQKKNCNRAHACFQITARERRRYRKCDEHEGRNPTSVSGY